MEIQKIFTDYSGERFYSVRLSEPELLSYQKEFGIYSWFKKKFESGIKHTIKKAGQKADKKVVDKGKAVVEDGAKTGSKKAKEKIAKETEIAEKTKQAEQQAKQEEANVANQQEGFFGKHWKALSAGTAGLGGAYLLWGNKKPERRYNDYGYGHSETYGRY